jgi:arylformamidase
MRIYDITASIYPGMPVYPGDPEVAVDTVSSVEDGAAANVSCIRMGSHTGTHVDPPGHLMPGGAKVDELPLDVLVGPAVVVASKKPEIGREFVDKEVKPGYGRVLIKTSGRHAAGIKAIASHLTAEGASRLVEMGVSLVGIESQSVDAPGTEGLPAHAILLGGGAVIVEGLDLAGVSPGSYELICLPLKLKGGDGAPARVILRETGATGTREG